MTLLSFFGSTDPGNKRPKNEDNLWPVAGQTQHPYADSPFGQLFVVADGMGGYGAGDVASSLTVETVREVFYSPETAPKSPEARLELAIQAAHQKITAESQTSETKSRMGTTVVAAVIKDKTLWVAWVGDSRAYLVRNKKLMQLTEDHSVLWEQIKAGQISWEALHYHPKRSKLNNSITARRDKIVVSHVRHALRNDDQILLCSDGLSSEVRDAEIEKILNAHSLRQSVASLIAEAKEEKVWLREGKSVRSEGGEDNVTSIVIHMPDVIIVPPPPAPTPTRWLIPVAIAAVLLLLGLATGAYFLLSPPPPNAAALSPAEIEGTRAAGGEVNVALGEAVAAPQSSPDIESASDPATPPASEPTSTLANVSTSTRIPPTATATPRPTLTATVSAATGIMTDMLSPPELLAPEDDPPPNPKITQITKDPLEFRWQWDGELDDNMSFEILIWRDQADPDPLGAYDARELKGLQPSEDGTYKFTLNNLNDVPSVKKHGDGNYLWTVALVQLDPIKRLAQADPFHIAISFPGASSSGGDDSDGGGGGGGPSIGSPN